MDNKDKEELLPCPFCGGKAVYLTQNNSYYIHVAICCKQCECQTSYYKSKDKAIAA